jgi:hypothetical protein
LPDYTEGGLNLGGAVGDVGRTRSSIDVIEEFFGETLSTALIRLIKRMPKKQLSVLRDRLDEFYSDWLSEEKRRRGAEDELVFHRVAHPIFGMMFGFDRFVPAGTLLMD